jgi:hypothetical protein
MRHSLLFALAIAVGLGASGVASAQTIQPPPLPTVPGTQEFQQGRDALMGQAQKSVDSANANIDALNKMAQSQTGTAKKQSQDLAGSLATQRDKVTNDIDKMAKANVSDWAGLQQGVTKDLGALNQDLKSAAALTHLPVPSL